jgi:hypothetical protein
MEHGDAESPPMTTLPATYEEGLAKLVAPLIARVEDRLREDSDAIEIMLCDLLVHRDLEFQKDVIRSAESGDPLAHRALLRTYKELRNRRIEPPVVIEGYFLIHHDRPPPKGRGRFKKSLAFGAQPVAVSFIQRDYGVVLLICLACVTLGLRPTRSATTEGPSGSSVVSLALKSRSRGVWISEKRLNDLYSRWGRIVETNIGRAL